MSLSIAEIKRVVAAAEGLPIAAPAERVEDFFGRILGLTAAEQVQYFPDPDPSGKTSIAIGHLTSARDDILKHQRSIPTFTIYNDSLQKPLIAGIKTHLAAGGEGNTFLNRLAHHKPIREAIIKLRRGHYLEAIAATIMSGVCEYGEATRGSIDQGIDALGWKRLVLIHRAFCAGNIKVTDDLPGEKVFLFASSKAVQGRGVKLISPAHIRELVGGWIIQRSPAGAWSGVGIRTLTPVQMILVTTYRLSEESLSLCYELGIQVWGIPELIYLICKWAPSSVFNDAGGGGFLKDGFKRWWQPRHLKRLPPPKK